jgi:hypothetical protein
VSGSSLNGSRVLIGRKRVVSGTRFASPTWDPHNVRGLCESLVGGVVNVSFLYGTCHTWIQPACFFLGKRTAGHFVVFLSFCFNSVTSPPLAGFFFFFFFFFIQLPENQTKIAKQTSLCLCYAGNQKY